MAGAKKARKAQLFLVGIIFITGAISAMQAVLMVYSMLGALEPLRDNDAYLFQNLREVVNATVTGVSDCSELPSILNRLKYFLSGHARLLEYSTEVTFSVNCSNWNAYPPSPAPVNVYIGLKGRKPSPKTETSAYLDVYNTIGVYP